MDFCKRPGALFVEAAEVFLHLGNVGFEIMPDQLGVELHVLFGLRQDWFGEGDASGCGPGLARKKDRQRQGSADYRSWQGKPPLPPLN